MDLLRCDLQIIRLFDFQRRGGCYQDGLLDGWMVGWLDGWMTWFVGFVVLIVIEKLDGYDLQIIRLFDFPRSGRLLSGWMVG